jgi:WD40 repeat protein
MDSTLFPSNKERHNAATGYLLADLRGNDKRLWTVAIAADGNTLVGDRSDGKVIFWDIRPKTEPVATRGDADTGE